jgi:hypothetical protein
VTTIDAPENHALLDKHEQLTRAAAQQQIDAAQRENKKNGRGTNWRVAQRLKKNPDLGTSQKHWARKTKSTKTEDQWHRESPGDREQEIEEARPKRKNQTAHSKKK